MNSWMSGIHYLLFLGLWRMVYEVANTDAPGSRSPVSLSPQTYQPEAQTQLQKEWAARAVKKYAEAQKRKWQRWNEAMFERSD